jgi:hypothetical protein
MTPHASGNLKCQYVVGSAEWNTVTPTYSDAFFMGIRDTAAGLPVPTNVALLPGTNTPIAITTITRNVNSQYLVLNPKNTTLFAPTNVEHHVGYQGFTTLLETVPYSVQAGKTYRISLKIADGDDKYYDSTVWRVLDRSRWRCSLLIPASCDSNNVHEI